MKINIVRYIPVCLLSLSIFNSNRSLASEQYSDSTLTCSECSTNVYRKLAYLYGDTPTSPTMELTLENTLERAQLNNEIGNYDRAILDAFDVQSEDSDNLFAKKILKDAYGGKNMLEEAAENASALSSETPDDWQNNLEAAELLYRKGLEQKEADINGDWEEYFDDAITLLRDYRYPLTRDVNLLSTRAERELSSSSEYPLAGAGTISGYYTVLEECDIPLVIFMEAASFHYENSNVSTAIELIQEAIHRQALHEDNKLCTEETTLVDPIGFPPEWRYILAYYIKQNNPENPAWRKEAIKVIKDIDLRRAATKDSAFLSALRAHTCLLLGETLRARSDAKHAAEISPSSISSDLPSETIIASLLPEYLLSID